MQISHNNVQMICATIWTVGSLWLKKAVLLTGKSVVFKKTQLTFQLEVFQEGLSFDMQIVS
jgi:hypothetical protein